MRTEVVSSQVHEIPIENSSLFILKTPDLWFEADSGTATEVREKLSMNDNRLIEELGKLAPLQEKLNPGHIFSHPVLRLTNRCNLACTHCYQDVASSMRHKVKDLDLTHASRFLDFISSQSDPKTGERYLRTIQIFGGEPTLHPQFFEFLNKSLSLKPEKIRISTNATTPLFKSKSIEPHLKNRRIEWRVSLESIQREFHEKLRPKSFDRVVSGLKYLTESGANVSVKMVLTSENIESLERTMDALHEWKIPHFTYRVLFEQGSALRFQLKKSFDDFTVVSKLIEILRRKPHLAPMLKPSPLGRWLRSLFIDGVEVYPQIHYYIDADGKIYPNDKLCEESTFEIGDINEQMYRPEQLLKFQHNLEANLPICQTCPFERYCFKGNLGLLYKNDLSMSDHFAECSSVKRLLPFLMSLGSEAANLTEKMFRTETPN